MTTVIIFRYVISHYDGSKKFLLYQLKLFRFLNYYATLSLANCKCCYNSQIRLRTNINGFYSGVLMLLLLGLSKFEWMWRSAFLHSIIKTNIIHDNFLNRKWHKNNVFLKNAFRSLTRIEIWIISYMTLQQLTIFLNKNISSETMILNWPEDQNKVGL